MPPRLSYRRRLRSRIIISYALLGFGLAALFAGSAIYIRSHVENSLISGQLLADVADIVTQVRANPTTRAGTRLLIPYVYASRKYDEIPPSWADLKTGVYNWSGTGPPGTNRAQRRAMAELAKADTDEKTHHYKLAVHRAADYSAFELYDVTREETSKRELMAALIGTIVLLSVFSLLVGFWLSARVIRPLTELAQRLRGFREDGRVAPLAPHFANDEVGELASALDDYAQRLTHLVERDREFNSDVSHELRTPLAVIGTTTELLLSKPEIEEKVRERLTRIERATRQSTELIEALLLLSRAERSGPVDGETSDVNQVAADVIASQLPQLSNKPIKVRLVEDAKLAVNAPASVLAVALTNLVGNAIKYTQQGEVTVRVCAEKVAIEDTGKGISSADAEHLFQRGVRGEGVTGSGAGLGLAIVRRLCELYGWTVSLQPREGGVGAVAVLNFRMP